MPGSDSRTGEDRLHLSCRDLLTGPPFLCVFSTCDPVHADGEAIPSYASIQGFNSDSEPPSRAWPARAVLWKELG